MDQGCKFVRIVIDRLENLHDVDWKDALSAARLRDNDRRDYSRDP